MLSNSLDELKNIFDGKRSEYGNQEDSFERIADYWTQYAKHNNWHQVMFSKYDVAKMMILLKLARDEFESKHDNMIDIAGYALLGDEVAPRSQS